MAGDRRAGEDAGPVTEVALNPLRALDAVEVAGTSMAPALEPGDRLLVESWTFRRRAPLPGEVVVAADPREPDRELVKRVVAVGDAGIFLRGDNPTSTDSRTFGAVRADAVRWRAAFRYWPPRRVGRVPRAVVSG